MNLDDELRSAWASVSPPPRSAITEHDCAECIEIQDFFAGKSWTELTEVASLRYHHEALHLFAPSAYHYYLPAFIRATFADPQAADLIPDAIVSTIRLEFGAASRGRLELFSSTQRAVLARFLRALPSLDEDLITMAELLRREQ